MKVNIKDLSYMMSDDIFEKLYESRQFDLDKITVCDEKDLKELKVIRDNIYAKIEQTLKQENFKQEKLLKLIDEHSQANLDINSYFQEKNYKAGLMDGIKLIIQGLET